MCCTSITNLSSRAEKIPSLHRGVCRTTCMGTRGVEPSVLHVRCRQYVDYTNFDTTDCEKNVSRQSSACAGGPVWRNLRMSTCSYMHMSDVQLSDSCGP